MTTRKMSSLLSIGLSTGFVIGFSQALYQVCIQRYFQLKMYRLIALEFQASLNKQAMLFFGIACGMVFFIVLIERLYYKFQHNQLLPFRMFISIGQLIEERIFFKVALCLVVFLLGVNGLILIDKKKTPAGPNIVLIVVDCLRADHLSCYGYDRNTSPSIDRFAKNGIIFKNAYSPSPWTKPTVASLFTSLYPENHGVTTFSHVLQDGFLTLAEILKNNQYQTLFFNGGNVHLTHKFNYDQGFDVYEMFRYADMENPQSAADVTESFIDHISMIQDKAFFAYVHFMDPHLPYNKNKYNEEFAPENRREIKPGSEWEQVLTPGKMWVGPIKKYSAEGKLTQVDKETIKALYDGQISYTDENIGRIIDFLEDREMFGNTILVITSDHGEEFWEHNGFEHGHSLYNELIHVPLIVGGNNLGISEIEGNVSSIDIMPTLLDACNIKFDEDKMKGRSLKTLLKNDNFNNPVFASTPYYKDEKYAVMMGYNKAIWNTGFRGEREVKKEYRSEAMFEFYNLKKDPMEKSKLEITDNNLFGDLKKKLKDFKIKQARVNTVDTVLDESTKESLKTLGYIE